jgi:hypothetical protein
VKAKYGPYAENLNHVLRTMDGHYTIGYGDRSREPQISLLDGAALEASKFLEGHPETLERLHQVSKLVEGWETPYSLELLATTHWALTRRPDKGSREKVHQFVISWTPRKADLFKPKQIDRAIDRLVESGFAAPV